jgi:hypothetical protein
MPQNIKMNYIKYLQVSASNGTIINPFFMTIFSSSRRIATSTCASTRQVFGGILLRDTILVTRSVRVGEMNHIRHVIHTAGFDEVCSILIFLIRNVTAIFGINVFNVTHDRFCIRTHCPTTRFTLENQFGRLCFGEAFDATIFAVHSIAAIAIIIVRSVILVAVVVVVVVVVIIVVSIAVRSVLTRRRTSRHGDIPTIP